MVLAAKSRKDVRIASATIMGPHSLVLVQLGDLGAQVDTQLVQLLLAPRVLLAERVELALDLIHAPRELLERGLRGVRRALARERLEPRGERVHAALVRVLAEEEPEADQRAHRRGRGDGAEQVLVLRLLPQHGRRLEQAGESEHHSTPDPERAPFAGRGASLTIQSARFSVTMRRRKPVGSPSMQPLSLKLSTMMSCPPGTHSHRRTLGCGGMVIE